MPTSTPKKISQLNELAVQSLNDQQDYVPVLRGATGETMKMKAVAFTTFTLPIATSTDLGGIKVGGTLAINAGTGVLNLGGLNSAGTYGTASAVPRITVDGYGRVTTVSTVPLTLGNITDVSLSTPSNQQVLRFNGTSGKWENTSLTETLTLDSLSDVGITSPSGGQYLRYSGTAWVNGALGAADLTGTIPSTVLGNSSFFIGTTSVALNRASGALSLTGISIDGNAGTVTNGVYTTGSYTDPTWLTITKAKVGLGNVENTALSTWAGSASITTIGTLASGTVPVARVSGLATSATTDTTNATNISSGTLAAARLPAFTGDATSTAGTSSLTLASTTVTAASYGSATQVATFTVDAKGRLTAAANTTITPAWSSITSTPTTLSGYGITDAAPKASPTFTGTVTAAKSVGQVSALADGATITPDFSVGNNFSVTLGGNRTLANPTNVTAGQSGVIVITQDATGSRTLAYGSNFKFPSGTAPTLTTTANAVDVLAFYVESASRITARLINDVK